MIPIGRFTPTPDHGCLRALLTGRPRASAQAPTGFPTPAQSVRRPLERRRLVLS